MRCQSPYKNGQNQNLHFSREYIEQHHMLILLYLQIIKNKRVENILSYKIKQKKVGNILIAL